MRDWVTPRSILFVPADRADLVEKAIAGDADAICLDLEDGVAAGAKPAARLAIPAFLDAALGAGKSAVVRINAGSNHDANRDDVAALPNWNAVIALPKAGPASIQNIPDANAGVIAMIEDLASLQGLLNAPGPRPKSIIALALGSEDLSADLGTLPNSTLLTLALYDLVKLGRMWDVPVMGMPCSIANFTDLAEFKDGAEAAAKIGVTGAFCIHPAQISALHTGFAPSEAAVSWARAIVNCADVIEARGVAVHPDTGQMLDLPVLAQARKILTRSG